MAEPIYRRIAEDLRWKIEEAEGDDKLPRGSQLPTENELMEQYSASRNTIREAVRQLVSRGLIETRPGLGTFVTDEIIPFVTTLTGDPLAGGGEGIVYFLEAEAQGRVPDAKGLKVGIEQASESTARALRIPKGEEVVYRHEQRLIDGTICSLQTSFYPMSLVTRGAPSLLSAVSFEHGAIAYLARTLGLRQVGYRDLILVRNPDEVETNAFRLPADGRVQIFELSRVSFDQDGHPIRLTVTVCPTDRNRFVINVGEVPAGEEAG